MSNKTYAFDACFFAYSLTLPVYLALATFDTAHSTQEAALANFLLLAWLLAISIPVMAAVSFVLNKLNIPTLGAILFSKAARGKFWRAHLALTFLLSLAVSLRLSEFSVFELTDANGLAGAMRLYEGMTHANLNLLPLAIVQVIETIFIAFLATVAAVPAAFVISFLSAKNIMTHPVAFAIYAAIRTVQNIVRSVEPLIWALVFTVWVGIGPFAGMLALAVHSLASLAKQFSEIIEDISPGPVEAIRATGASPLQVIWYGMVPQVLMPFISFTIYRWDTNVRMATIIGFVGGGGIGTLLLKYQGQAMWPEVGCIIFVIAAAVWVMDVASAYFREALR